MSSEDEKPKIDSSDSGPIPEIKHDEHEQQVIPENFDSPASEIYNEEQFSKNRSILDDEENKTEDKPEEIIFSEQQKDENELKELNTEKNDESSSSIEAPNNSNDDGDGIPSKTRKIPEDLNLELGDENESDSEDTSLLDLNNGKFVSTAEEPMVLNPRDSREQMQAELAQTYQNPPSSSACLLI